MNMVRDTTDCIHLLIFCRTIPQMYLYNSSRQDVPMRLCLPFTENTMWINIWEKVFAIGQRCYCFLFEDKVNDASCSNMRQSTGTNPSFSSQFAIWKHPAEKGFRSSEQKEPELLIPLQLKFWAADIANTELGYFLSYSPIKMMPPPGQCLKALAP